MAELSLDRKEFARLCAMEIQRAAKLSGGRMPDADFIREMSIDIASSKALSRVPCSRVPELFAIARSHYQETPVLRHLVKAWENHMMPKIESQTNTDVPRLPRPANLSNREQFLANLAAIRTHMADGHPRDLGSHVHGIEVTDEMRSMLADNPSEDETRVFYKVCPKSAIDWHRRNVSTKAPFWGHWGTAYGIWERD